MENPALDTRKRAIFLDLDGTLWDREVVPASAWQAIKQARANGHLVFVNTGRREDSIPQFLWDAQLDGYCLATGMKLIANQEVVASHTMDKEAVEKIAAYLNSQGSGYGLEADLITFDDPKYAFRHKVFFDKEQRLEKNLRVPLSRLNDELKEEIVKVVFDCERRFPLEEKAKELGFDVLIYSNRFTPVADMGSLFRGEITDARWNKAHAMRSMLEAMKLDPNDYLIVAIGDSENDIPMFEEADVAICMGNGTKSAKEHADHLSDHINCDGLAKALAWLNTCELEAINLSPKTVQEEE